MEPTHYQKIDMWMEPGCSIMHVKFFEETLCGRTWDAEDWVDETGYSDARGATIDNVYTMDKPIHIAYHDEQATCPDCQVRAALGSQQC